MSMGPTTVCVIGAGSWGTALALQLVRNGHNINLWGHEPDHIERLLSERENKEFLPGIQLPDAIRPMASLQQATQGIRHILVVIPSKAYREFLKRLKP